MKTILVDDENKSIEVLKSKIEDNCPELEVVASYTDPIEALQMINEIQPYLIFLDVTMPKMSGLELLDRIEYKDKQVIFATAYDKYAMDAVNRSACGYLLKPFDNEKLKTIVSQANESYLDHLEQKQNKELVEQLQTFKIENEKILIPTRSSIEFVEVSDLIFCEGIEGYTKLHLRGGGELVSSLRLGKFESSLRDFGFFRIHKSYIINIDCIIRINSDNSIELKEDKVLPLSRSKRHDFLEVLKVYNISL